MSNIVPFEQQMTLARAFARSGLFGLKDETQALALMALCEAEGLHPAQAIRDYHIIQGKPAMKADAMLARFQKAGGSVSWSAYGDDQVVGTFTHPQGGSVTIDWTIARAKGIGLAGKDNWKHYPRNMLRARCISEGVRAVYPGIATGIYTPEELQDMSPQEVRDMGPAEIVPPAELAPELAERCKAAVDQGLEAYAAFWKALSADERKAIGPSRHADFKSAATEVMD